MNFLFSSEIIDKTEERLSPERKEGDFSLSSSKVQLIHKGKLQSEKTF